jgi:hypothetical protein
MILAPAILAGCPAAADGNITVGGFATPIQMLRLHGRNKFILYADFRRLRATDRHHSYHRRHNKPDSFFHFVFSFCYKKTTIVYLVVGALQQLSRIARLIRFIRHTPTVVGVFSSSPTLLNGL